MCTADSTQGGASQWVHVPWGNCASRTPPSHEEGVALLVARTCNAASGTRGSRLEYVQRVLVSYSTTAAAAARIL